MVPAKNSRQNYLIAYQIVAISYPTGTLFKFAGKGEGVTIIFVLSCSFSSRQMDDSQRTITDEDKVCDDHGATLPDASALLYSNASSLNIVA